MSNWAGFEALVRELERHRDMNAANNTPYSLGVAQGLQMSVDWLKLEIHRMALDAQLAAVKGGTR